MNRGLPSYLFVLLCAVGTVFPILVLGDSFSEPIPVNTDEVRAVVASRNFRNEMVLSDDGHLNIAFTGVQKGQKHTDIFLRRFPREGEAGDLIRVTENPALDRAPSLFIGGSGEIHLAWLRDLSILRPKEEELTIQVVYKRSEDGGDSWSAESVFPVGMAGSRMPALQGDPAGTLYLYVANSLPGENPSIFLWRSPDAGLSWEMARPLGGSGGIAESPDLEIAGPGMAHLIWLDTRFGSRSVVVSETMDAGRTWSEPRPLNENLELTMSDPHLAVTETGVHALWHEQRRNEARIFHRFWKKEGGWSAEKLILSSQVEYLSGKAFPLGSRLLLSWTDHRSRVGARGELLRCLLWDQEDGWQPAEPLALNGLSQDLLRFNGFDVATTEKQVVVGFAEKQGEDRWKVYLSFSDEPTEGFGKRLQIAPPKARTAYHMPRLDSDGTSIYVLYNTQELPVAPVKPASPLGDLFLVRFQMGSQLSQD